MLRFSNLFPNVKIIVPKFQLAAKLETFELEQDMSASSCRKVQQTLVANARKILSLRKPLGNRSVNVPKMIPMDAMKLGLH